MEGDVRLSLEALGFLLKNEKLEKQNALKILSLNQILSHAVLNTNPLTGGQPLRRANRYTTIH